MLATLLLMLLGRSKIALLSYHDGDDVHTREHEGRFNSHTSLDVHNISRICTENHRAYSRLYGYTYINPMRARSWSRLLLNGKRFKLVLISKALRKFNYILWVDADVAFHTMQSVQEWIGKMMSKDILVAADIGGSFKFNSGLMLFRATNKTRSFVADVIKEVVKLPLRGLQDQRAMQIVAERKQYKDVMLVLRPRAIFQAFAKLKEIQKNSWTVHYTCCNMKCGGSEIPRKYCDPTQHDFRSRHFR